MVKCLLHKFALSACVLAVAVAAVVAPQAASAQDDTAAVGIKPVAVVSLSGYNELIGDLNFIGKLVERPGLAQMAEGTLALFTQGKGLDGLDKTKPLGAYVTLGDTGPQAVVFLPVEDLSKLVAALSALTGPAEERDDGAFVFESPNGKVVAQQKGGWAFLCRESDEAAAKAAPDNPVALLSGLDKQYDLAVRVNVQNVPAPLRAQAVEQLKLGVELGLERLPDEDDEAYELRKKIVQNQVKQMDTLVNETDHLTFGWKVDAEAETTFLEVSMVAIPGGKIARQAAQLGESTSSHTGFLMDDAAVKFNMTSPVGSEEDVAQAISLLDTVKARVDKAIDEDSDLPDEAARAIVKSAFADVLDVLKATLNEGKIDGGGLVQLNPESMTLAFGMHVADGKRLESALKKVLKLAEDDPDFKGIQWNADEHEGVQFHTLAAPVADPDAQKLLGDPLDVVIGVSQKSVYVAFGKNSLATLKAVIDKSKADAGKKVPPMQMAVSLAKVLKFAAAQEDNDNPMVAVLAQMLADTDGKDHVRITVNGIQNGFAYRIEAEEGVLRAVGKASTTLGAPGAGPGGLPPGGDDF